MRLPERDSMPECIKPISGHCRPLLRQFHNSHICLITYKHLWAPISPRCALALCQMLPVLIYGNSVYRRSPAHPAPIPTVYRNPYLGYRRSPAHPALIPTVCRNPYPGYRRSPAHAALILTVSRIPYPGNRRPLRGSRYLYPAVPDSAPCDSHVPERVYVIGHKSRSR